MTVLILEQISKAYQGKPILAGVDLTLRKGEKAGLVGRNGCGKTTLLGIIAGTIEPDGGARRMARLRSIGSISQEADFRGCATVLEAASMGQVRIREIEEKLEELVARISRAAADPGGTGESEAAVLDRLLRQQADLEEEYRLLGGYLGPARVQAVLAGIGFLDSQLATPPDALSGGEKRRLQMARLLLGGHDLLLLDEPGNHLDIHGLEWLTRFLKEHRGTVLVVSHDRYLLNAVAERIVELEGGRVQSFAGDYEAYRAARAEQREAADKAIELKRRAVEKDKEFIRRTHYGQKAKQAKSRAKRLERLERLEIPGAAAGHDRRPAFSFAEAAASGEVVLRVEGLSAAIGGRCLFQGLDFVLERGEILGVIGRNGCGKTTFLKLILGRSNETAGADLAVSGSVALASTARPVYFDQSLTELDGEGTALEELRIDAPTLTDGELRSHLARFLIIGEDGDKQVRDLSGGEKSRLLLARLTLRKSNLLVLDEPTNHLDIYTREALEETLLAYSGTVIMVTHDRRLLDRTAGKVLLLDGERSRLHHGGTAGLAAAAPAASPRAGKSGPKKGARERRPAQSAHQARAKRRHTLEDLEKLIMEREGRLKEAEEAFYTEEVYMSRERCRELESEVRALRTELAELYREWETWT